MNRRAIQLLRSSGIVLLLTLAFSFAARGQQQPAPAPAAAPPPAGAPIQIVLKTGQAVETVSIRRERDMVMARVQVGASTGEVGYQLGQIQKLVFPEARGLKAAAELLSQGQAERALAEIHPVVTYHAPFRDIEGSLWGEAALLKVSAFAALKRDRDAEPLAQEIQRMTKDPEVARAANLRVAAALISKQQYDKALQICDAAIKDSTQPFVLADAWVSKGNLHFAQKQWGEALLAYLHVPIFYPGEKQFLPQAMLGTARSYRRVDDLERAKRSFNELIALFPKSAEATVAQAELQKIK